MVYRCKGLLVSLSVVLSVLAHAGKGIISRTTNFPVSTAASTDILLQQKADAIFDSLHLNKAGLEREVFYKAYKGYTYLLYNGQVNNPNILSIADFSQSSKNKRLYVIDLANYRLAFNTWVSHGKNSGHEMATSFSNLPDSYKSAVGFMLTDDTYNGHCGYSLRFNGVEPGFNDRIRNRAIIVHGSWYVNEDQANEEGRVGNSLGCPAVPMKECHQIIDFIKGGTVYFIYSPNEDYNAASPILNGTLVVPPTLIPAAILPKNAIGPLPFISVPAGINNTNFSHTNTH